MLFNMKMFEAELPLAANRSVGYESVLKHSHSFVELVYVENGEGTQKLGNGQKMPLKKGDVFIIGDDTQHSIRPTCEESQFRIINILFEKDVIDVDYERLVPVQPKNFPSGHPIIRYINQCVDEYEMRSEELLIRMKGLIYLILAEYLSFDAEHKYERKRKLSADYVREATKFIHENYDKKLTLNMIAERVGVTSGYLQRLFRENCKTSVIEYLLRHRVENACKMLVETDIPIQEICVKSGFTDAGYFSTVFRKYENISPVEYRRKNNADINL